MELHEVKSMQIKERHRYNKNAADINISGREKETELTQKNDYEVKSKLSRVRARNLLEIEFDLTAL